MYAISVDTQKKRVTVVFRGAITRPDWNHAFDGNLKKIQNPVKDDYEGKSSIIRVHRGFHTYLMRQVHESYVNAVHIHEFTNALKYSLLKSAKGHQHNKI